MTICASARHRPCPAPLPFLLRAFRPPRPLRRKENHPAAAFSFFLSFFFFFFSFFFEKRNETQEKSKEWEKRAWRIVVDAANWRIFMNIIGSTVRLTLYLPLSLSLSVSLSFFLCLFRYSRMFFLFWKSYRNPIRFGTFHRHTGPGLQW